MADVELECTRPGQVQALQIVLDGLELNGETDDKLDYTLQIHMEESCTAQDPACVELIVIDKRDLKQVSHHLVAASDDTIYSSAGLCDLENIRMTHAESAEDLVS